MAFLLPNQQHQSTEGTVDDKKLKLSLPPSGLSPRSQHTGFCSLVSYLLTFLLIFGPHKAQVIVTVALNFPGVVVGYFLAEVRHLSSSSSSPSKSLHQHSVTVFAVVYRDAFVTQQGAVQT